MNTNEHELVFKNEVFQLVGAAFEVLNQLGHGFLEKPYENALITELELRGIPFRQQPRFNIPYKGRIVGEYIPDLVVYEQVVAEIKCIPKISNLERAQVVNYLRATGLKVGVILNFRNPRLEWERIVV